MNETLHGHLNKLRIISKIRAGQRLDTTNDLTVYEESYYNWAMRKYYHDSKDEGVRYLQDLFRKLDQAVDQLVKDISTTKDKIKKRRKLQVAVTMATLVKSAVDGIENLSKTYEPYPKTTSNLEGVVQDFAIVTYTQLLNVIPTKTYSRALRESISYNGVILYLGLDAKIQAEADLADNEDDNEEPTSEEEAETRTLDEYLREE